MNSTAILEYIEFLFYHPKTIITDKVNLYYNPHFYDLIIKLIDNQWTSGLLFEIWFNIEIQRIYWERKNYYSWSSIYFYSLLKPSCYLQLISIEKSSLEVCCKNKDESGELFDYLLEHGATITSANDVC